MFPESEMYHSGLWADISVFKGKFGRKRALYLSYMVFTKDDSGIHPRGYDMISYKKLWNWCYRIDLSKHLNLKR